MFNVFDKRLEEDFDFGNRPHRFVDLETGESVKLTPSEYKVKFNLFKTKQLNYLKTKLLNFGVDYVELNINSGFKKVLETYLIKRSSM